jgi:tagatose 1,6-diphosphate aldolase
MIQVEIEPQKLEGRLTAMNSKLPDITAQTPPESLAFGEVHLLFAKVNPGAPQRGLMPGYHFRILKSDGTDVGHINFRVDDSEHLRLCAGHIGYAINEAHRGHGYAWQACRALAPFVHSLYPAVIVTCDPDNIASIRTIEKLGAHFMEEISIPEHDPDYPHGARKNGVICGNRKS